jgi:hypothetical protein
MPILLRYLNQRVAGGFGRAAAGVRRPGPRLVSLQLIGTDVSVIPSMNEGRRGWVDCVARAAPYQSPTFRAIVLAPPPEVAASRTWAWSASFPIVRFRLLIRAGASRLLELGTSQACGQTLGRPIQPPFLPRVIIGG